VSLYSKWVSSIAIPTAISFLLFRESVVTAQVSKNFIRVHLQGGLAFFAAVCLAVVAGYHLLQKGKYFFSPSYSGEQKEAMRALMAMGAKEPLIFIGGPSRAVYLATKDENFVRRFKALVTRSKEKGYTPYFNFSYSSGVTVESGMSSQTISFTFEDEQFTSGRVVSEAMTELKMFEDALNALPDAKEVVISKIEVRGGSNPGLANSEVMKNLGRLMIQAKEKGIYMFEIGGTHATSRGSYPINLKLSPTQSYASAKSFIENFK